MADITCITECEMIKPHSQVLSESAVSQLAVCVVILRFTQHTFDWTWFPAGWKNYQKFQSKIYPSKCVSLNSLVITVRSPHQNKKP